MKSITVKLEEKEIEIKRLPLRKYAELLGALGAIPKRISSLGDINNDVILANLPKIITENYPDVINIFAIATELPKEEIEELGLDEAVSIAIGIWEVNDYREIYEKVKKVLPSQTKPAAVVTTPSGSTQ